MTIEEFIKKEDATDALLRLLETFSIIGYKAHFKPKFYTQDIETFLRRWDDRRSTQAVTPSLLP